MARIRSVHPGLTTDEVYMSMSAFAKAAWPTLWTECDDQGAFEWKPVVLKARLLPADAVDFAEVLEEWLRLGAVTKYEHDGKQYGLVRNFGRYQRPKKPKSVHFIPDELRTYCALGTPSSVPDTLPEVSSSVPVPPKSEIAPQMKEEGGREKTSLRSVQKPAKGMRLPADWSLSPTNRDYARSQGLNDHDIDRESEAFRDWWPAQPGQKGVKADWDATWRTWVRNAVERRGIAPKGPANGEKRAQVNHHGDIVDWDARLEFAQKHGRWVEEIWGSQDAIPADYRERFNDALQRH